MWTGYRRGENLRRVRRTGSSRARSEGDREPKGCRSTNDRRGTNLANPRSGASCNMLEAGYGANRRGGRNHEGGTCRKIGIFRPKRSERTSRGNTERDRRRAGVDVSGETRKRGEKQDERFQERRGGPGRPGHAEQIRPERRRRGNG